MSKNADNKLKELSSSDDPIDVAGDLYAPDAEEGGTGDLTETAKVTLRAYMTSLTEGDGPHATPDRPIPRNTDRVPGEGESSPAGRLSHLGAVEAEIPTRISAEFGRDGWTVGKDFGVRNPFEKMLGALKEAYPLGQYKAADPTALIERPGTIPASLLLPKTQERNATIGGSNPHTTERTAAGDETTEKFSEIHDAVSHALSFNRFSPTAGSKNFIDPASAGSPFVVDGAKTKLGWTFQFGNLGKYNPDAEELSGKDIGSIGKVLVTSQTGHTPSFDDVELLGKVESLFPTLTQIGLGSSMDLRALTDVQSLITGARRDVYTRLDDRVNSDEIGDNNATGTTLGTSMRIAGDQTYGALNSYREPFEGSISLIFVAILQFVAVLVIGVLINILLLDFLNPEVRTFDQRNRRGKELRLGKNKENDFSEGGSDDILEFYQGLFGVPEHLQHDFDSSFFQGLAGFYNFDLDSISSDPVGFFKSAFDSSGFYAIVVRLVTQDLFDGPEIADLFEQQDAISAIVKMFGVMRRSHTLKFVMTMVKLGDQILQLEDGTRLTLIKEGASRLPSSNALGAGGSPAMMLGSEKLQTLANTIDAKAPSAYSHIIGPSQKQLTKTGKIEIDFYKKHTEGRGGIYRHKADSFIPVEIRDKFESIMDATYCPFYFHDLRTNEMISFHAFLGNLNDSYQASYDEITGYGRVEPAKTYKSTTRTISMTFKVAAMTAEDMDIMYLKLNRLVAMAYPQYTAGRGVSLDGKLARAPFSQIPASTPLIRLRVGDVIGSNGSKLALARLHGAAEAIEPAVENDAVDTGAGARARGFKPDPTKVDKMTHVVLRGDERIFYTGENDAHASGFTIYDAVSMSRLNNDKPIKFPLRAQVSNGPTTKGGYQTLKIGTVTDATGVEIQEVFAPGVNGFFDVASGKGKMNQSTVYDKRNASPGVAGLKNAKSPFNPGDAQRQPPAGTKKFGLFGDADNVEPICILHADVAQGPSDESFNPSDKATKAGTPAFASLDLSDVNKMGSVAKSFRDSGGQGLAGVITSIDLGNLVDVNAVWSIDPGYRAPRMVDVTVSFAVVHDIPPGLDSLGHMNSAIYGVGASSVYNRGKF